MRRLRAQIGAMMRESRIDALFYPTLVTPGARIGDVETIDVEGEAGPVGPTLLRNTLLADLANLPSLSLPIGFCREGLPVGALLEGLPDGDGVH
jgi:Asp-tRNA(Asn)/Glu-tRNA(Gln) amidotransferase A subunit family amidase